MRRGPRDPTEDASRLPSIANAERSLNGEGQVPGGLKGRAAVVPAQAALSERSEDIRLSGHEGGEGFRRVHVGWQIELKAKKFVLSVSCIADGSLEGG